jgi:glycosyltransferase involved in cell wall biosynthesis
VDYFIANSHHTARRIWRCYRRESVVIYPPVNVDDCPFLGEKEDFYLIVSRLVSYKQVSLIIQAFNQLKKPLIVIGTGPEMKKLCAIAHPHIQILGWQPDDVVKKYMARAKAFVYAACEDFGIALVEAQACGTPIIAYGVGGALETVRDLRSHGDTGTGILFGEQTVTALVAAVEEFEAARACLNYEYIRLHSNQFSHRVFAEKYGEFLNKCKEKGLFPK